MTTVPYSERTDAPGPGRRTVNRVPGYRFVPFFSLSLWVSPSPFARGLGCGLTRPTPHFLTGAPPHPHHTAGTVAIPATSHTDSAAPRRTRTRLQASSLAILSLASGGQAWTLALQVHRRPRLPACETRASPPPAYRHD